MALCPQCNNEVLPVEALPGVRQCPLCQAPMSTGDPGASAPANHNPLARPAYGGPVHQPTSYDRPEGYNRQRSTVHPAAAMPSTHSPYGEAKPRVPGALTALIMGILAILTGIGALIFAPLAILFGVKARKRIAAERGVYSGRGMATAGIVMGAGIIALTILVTLAALAFVLVSDLSGGADAAAKIALQPGETYVQGFEITERDTRIVYSVDGGGEVVRAAIHKVDSLDDPDPIGPFYSESKGRLAEGEVRLQPGIYGLVMSCEDAPCTLDFVLEEI